MCEDPADPDEQGGEGDPEPPEGEERAEEHVEETDTEGLHADTTLLVVSRGHGAAAGGEEVEQTGELGFRSCGNEVGERHISIFIYN